MLTAINKNTKIRYNCCDGLPSNPKQIDWICPHCDKKLIHVKKSYEGKIEHFRHEAHCSHESEPETKNHLLMKKTIYSLMKQYYSIVELEKRIGNRIADIYIETQYNQKIAIECQASSISKKNFFDRSKSYTEKDVAVLWIWHQDMWEQNKCCQLMGGLGKWIYFNRIYLFDNGGKILRSRFGKEIPEELGVLFYNLTFGFSKVPNKYVHWEDLPRGETTIKIARFYDKKWWGNG